MTVSKAQWAMEVSSGFLLDQIKFGRRLFDFVDALIIVATTQANVDQVMRDPELQRAYADYESPPPEDLRRPISINALAQSLRLPFETVRRRVSRLVLFGVLKSGPDGVWTPGKQVRSGLHRNIAEAGYARLLALHGRIAGLADMPGLPCPEPSSDKAPPLRAAARISSEYLLRFVDLLTAEVGDPLDAAIWLEILRSNTAEAPAPSQRGPADRQPVRPAVVAKRLGLPAETVRRRVAHLVSRSACEHTPQGLVISDEILQRREYAHIAERNLADLRRMFGQLAQLAPEEPRLQAAA